MDLQGTTWQGSLLLQSSHKDRIRVRSTRGGDGVQRQPSSHAPLWPRRRFRCTWHSPSAFHVRLPPDDGAASVRYTANAM